MDPAPPRRPSFGWRQLRELDDGEGFEASHGNLQLALAHTAQGCDGDYDSGNPGDVPLMRYPFSGRSSPDAQWAELEDGDCLTDLSAGAPRQELAACARYIFQKVVDDIMAQGEDPTVNAAQAWGLVDHSLPENLATIEPGPALAAFGHQRLSADTGHSSGARLSYRLWVGHVCTPGCPEQGCFVDGLHVQALAPPAQGWLVSRGNLAMELEYLGMGVGWRV